LFLQRLAVDGDLASEELYCLLHSLAVVNLEHCTHILRATAVRLGLGDDEAAALVLAADLPSFNAALHDLVGDIRVIRSTVGV
jgi:hypothetical protein